MGGLVDTISKPFTFIGDVAEDLTGSQTIGDIVAPTRFINRELDLSGEQAAETAAAINRLLEQSASEGIELSREQLARIEELTAPFREAATGTALPTLSALAMGGEVDFQPSELFQTQLERGREGILRGQAAGPGLKSSTTFERLSDLVSGLAAEDVGRFERGQAGLLELGRGAEQGLLQAGGRLTGNIGDILTNLGAGQAATAQNLAQQQAATGQTIAGGLGSLAQLLAVAG